MSKNDTLGSSKSKTESAPTSSAFKSNFTPADQPDSGENQSSSGPAVPNTPKSSIAHHRRRALMRPRNKWNHSMHGTNVGVSGGGGGVVGNVSGGGCMPLNVIGGGVGHFGNGNLRHRFIPQHQQQQQPSHPSQQPMPFAALHQQAQFVQYHQQPMPPMQPPQAYGFHPHQVAAHRNNLGPHMGPPNMMPPNMGVHSMSGRPTMMGNAGHQPMHMPVHPGMLMHPTHNSNRKDSHRSYRINSLGGGGGANQRRRDQQHRPNHKSRDQRNNNNMRSMPNQTLGKRLVPAPYNTTQFLMDDHKCREPELDSFSDLISKAGGRDTDTEAGLDDDGNECASLGVRRRLPDRVLHTLNDESSSEEFYSSPDDEQDFMEKQFTETYDNIHAERLDLMSKKELMNEVLALEDRVKSLETELKQTTNNVSLDASELDSLPNTMLHPLTPHANNSTVGEISQGAHLRSRLHLFGIGAAGGADELENDSPDDHRRTRSRSNTSTSSSSSSNNSCSSCDSDDRMAEGSNDEQDDRQPSQQQRVVTLNSANSTTTTTTATITSTTTTTTNSDPDLRQLSDCLKHGINHDQELQLKEQLRRLLEENNRLKLENERLKQMLGEKENIAEQGSEMEFSIKEAS